MVHFLHGRNFENIEAVEVGLTEFFASPGLINLAEKWFKTIEYDGLHFEE